MEQSGQAANASDNILGLSDRRACPCAMPVIGLTPPHGIRLRQSDSRKETITGEFSEGPVGPNHGRAAGLLSPPPTAMDPGDIVNEQPSAIGRPS